MVEADCVRIGHWDMECCPPEPTPLKMPRLGVNVDHIATLRQARRGMTPSPIVAAQAAEKAGCDSIVCHLREDRRHIQESDLQAFKKILRVPLNLEMSAAPEIVRIACAQKPDQATLVPERRQELTTEGGLDLTKNRRRIWCATEKLQKARIRVSLFIDPDPIQIRLAASLGVPMVEFHTGPYAENSRSKKGSRFLAQLREAIEDAHARGLRVAAGHGLDYQNVKAVAQIPGIEELNIGFSIVAHSVEVGFHRAVKEMVALLSRRRL